MRHILTLILTVFVLGCAAPKKDNYIAYERNENIQVNHDKLGVLISGPEKIDIRGIINGVNDTEAGHMVYLGGAGVAGLFAQIATHAAAADETKNRKLSEQQIRANKVLEPLSHKIADLTISHLKVNDSGFSFIETPDEEHYEHILITQPVFYMSQDCGSLSVKNVVRLVSRDKVDAIIYQNLVEVIDNETVAPEEHTYINEQNIQEKLKALYIQSLRIATGDIAGMMKAKIDKKENFKIGKGLNFRFDRGMRLSTACGQQVFRNLRGWVVAFNEQINKQREFSCASL